MARFEVHRSQAFVLKDLQLEFFKVGNRLLKG